MLGLRPEDVGIVVDGDLSDDPVYAVTISTPNGSLQVMGAFDVSARTIVVRGLHIGGDPEL